MLQFAGVKVGISHVSVANCKWCVNYNRLNANPFLIEKEKGKW